MNGKMLEYIAGYLNIFGFAIHSFTYDAREYGSGLKVDRQLAFVLPHCTGALDQYADGYNTPDCFPHFDRAMHLLQMPQMQRSDAATYLLKDENMYMYFVSKMAEGRAIAERSHVIVDTFKGKKRKAGADTGEAWESDHLEAFRIAGMEWPPSSSWADDEATTCKHLPRRTQETAFDFAHHASTAQQSRDTFCDLNASIKASATVGHIGAITPGTVIFHATSKKIATRTSF